MGCPWSILAKAAIIIAVGVGAGFIDSRLRPVKLRLETVKSPAHGPSAEAPPKSPEVAPPKAIEKPPAVVTPPSGQPFVPTPADKLKPGHISLQDAFDQHTFDLAIFLDARSADEFAAGHIKGAHLAPLTLFRRNTPPAILSQIAKDQPIIVYCIGGNNCEASEDVALVLQQSGFINVSVFHDGWTGWAAMGYPSETGAPATP
ncbi:MAG: hypothetical protein KF745_05335 [Phycisphaeraceae bacterium]|nr:hypothetical protein [Phycisphaeraceae bacterium]